MITEVEDEKSERGFRHLLSPSRMSSGFHSFVTSALNRAIHTNWALFSDEYFQSIWVAPRKFSASHLKTIGSYLISNRLFSSCRSAEDISSRKLENWYSRTVRYCHSYSWDCSKTSFLHHRSMLLLFFSCCANLLHAGLRWAGLWARCQALMMHMICDMWEDPL